MTKKSLGRELIEAMEEAVADKQGGKRLQSRTVNLPPASIDVAGLRKRLRLSQREFADRFGFGVRALQEWEQGRREPERSVRILLKTIEIHPEAVEDALRAH